MNQIMDPPLEQNFGLDFNYWVWTANTEITLTNVPWNNDYRDVVFGPDFNTTAKLNAWIDSRESEVTKITNAMYAPVDRPIQIDIPYNLASRYNYVRVYNPGHSFTGSDIPRYLFYFITGTRYISTHNTELTVQLDVFQTFIRQVQFGRCYIERGHIGIANSLNFRNYGRDFLTVPEGLDVGSEYMNVASRSETIMSPRPSGYDILVVSTTELDRDPGTRNNPRLWSARGSNFLGVMSGASIYVFPSQRAFQAFMSSMSDKPWVTQGIISITAVPKILRYFPGHPYGVNAIGALSRLPTSRPNVIQHHMFNNWRNSSEIRNYIPERYRHLRKFYTSPYMMIEITSFMGTPIILRPEAWNSPNATVREFAALVPPEARIVFSPANYNSLRQPTTQPFEGSEYVWDGGEHLDLITQVTNLPRLAVVNNGALSYLAASAHSIAYGYQSADWSQQRAMRGADVAYDQAMQGISTARQMTEAGNQSMFYQLGVQQQLQRDNLIAGILGGSAMAGATGLAAGPIGGAAGVVGGIGAGVLNAFTLGNTQRAAVESASGAALHNWRTTDIGNSQSQYLADSNRGLAQWAARGDYENAIAGMNAKVRDAQLIQPSVSGQMGGEFLALLTNNLGFTIRWKMLDQAAISVVGEHWLRYGYAVRRPSLLPPTLQVMTKFTYWKLAETYIRQAPIPEGFKQVLRGIFEKGVTVWAHPEYIGQTDWADNEPLSGITLEGYEPPVPDIEPPIEPPTAKKRKVKRMLVYKTTDGEGDLWALAGTSPGTPANWIETRDSARALKFVQACGVDDAVTVTETDFYNYKADYIAPLATAEVVSEGGA